MRYILSLILCAIATSSYGQAYYAQENLQPRLTDGTGIVVVHNNTAYAAVANMAGGAWFNDIPANTTREILVPPGFSAYLVCNGAVNGMRDNLGSDVDSDKPWLRHIYILRDNQAPASIGYIQLPATQLANPYDQFKIGIAGGLTAAVGIAVLRVIRRAFSVSSE